MQRLREQEESVLHPPQLCAPPTDLKEGRLEAGFPESLHLCLGRSTSATSS